MKKLIVVLSVTALAGLGLAACGDDEEEAPPPEAPAERPVPPPAAEAETVSVSAPPDGSFAFDQETLRASAGQVTFEFDNPAALSHDVCVEDADGNDLGCSDQIADDETELTVSLEPGRYAYYCSVAGHREGGMEGALTVK